MKVLLLAQLRQPLQTGQGEGDLTSDVSFDHPVHLPLADHVHALVPLQYLAGSFNRKEGGKEGTMFTDLRKPTDLVVTVIILLAYGYPIQTTVKAYALDEWTVA